MDKRTHRGFTLIELIVVVILVAVMTAIILDRVQSYQEQAEKTAVEQVIAAVRSGLQLQMAALMVRGQRNKLSALVGQNPLLVLMEMPTNFGGNWRGAGQILERGTWYFDPNRRELIYRPNLDSRLTVQGITSAAEKVLRFRVELMGEISGQEITDEARATGIKIVPVSSYRWD